MINIPSVYERDRDDYRQPTFWRARDNACSPHFHSAIELSYLVDGEMEALVGGQPCGVGPGDLLIVSSYMVHRFTTPKSSENMVLIIPPDYISSFTRLTGGRRFASPVLPAGGASREIGRCLRRLLRTAGDEDLPDCGTDSYIVRGQIYTILGILLEHVPLQEEPLGESRTLVQELLRYLHSHHQQPLTQEEVAHAFGYSRSRISHIFNREVGCSIPEYIGALRSRTAASMLLENPGSITDAAMEAGFESMRTFYRAFKSCFGVTPSQFVKLSTGSPRPATDELSSRFPLDSGVPHR